MEYQVKKQVRIIDYDSNGRIKISSLLSIMQEAADEHTKALELNNASMMKSGYAWILTRQGIKIYKNTGNAGEVVVTTCALPSRSIEFPREYKVTSINGEPLAYSIGYWSVLDVAERRLVRATEVPGYTELLVEKDAEYKFVKLRGGETNNAEHIADHVVKNCEIDILGHLNNTFYPDMVYNALTSEEFAKDTSEFNITYVNEAKCGEKIAVYKEVGGENVKCVGKSANDEINFIAEIRYDK